MRPQLIYMLFLLNVFSTSEAYRILMVNPTLGISLKNIVYGLGKALVEEGHEVVLFSGYKPSSPVPGISEVVPEKLAKFKAEGWPRERERMAGPSATLEKYWALFQDGQTEALLGLGKELDQLLEEKFDLVVLTALSYSFYFVPYRLNVPFILLSGVSYWPHLSATMGNPTLPSIHPMVTMGSSDRMTFLERVESVLSHLAIGFLKRYVFMPYSDRLVSERYGDKFPRAVDIESNASMLFLSGTEMSDYHQPLLPNTVLIGGIMCEKPKQIPENIANFIANEDFIYFSIGTVARIDDITADQQAAILDGFARLPYKVLVKWDVKDQQAMPDNVFASKWFPQQDILGNSGCRLFITHGGVSSIQEAMCHGVPMLIIPGTADQFFNAQNAKRLGIANILLWDNLTADSFTCKVNKSLVDHILEAVKYRRYLLNSRPISSRKLATFWVEHVISHRGAPHLRSVASELYWFEYYSLDVCVFVALTVVIALKLMQLLLRFGVHLLSEQPKLASAALKRVPLSASKKKRA